MEARRPAWFALDSPQTLYFRFPSANRGPGFSRLAARRTAWFALTSPQALCFRFPGANLGPGFSGLEARRSAWFALDSPQALYFRFPGANLGPGISGLGARRPAWFALTFPQALCFRFPGANRRPGPAGFSKARFAPPSPRALAAPSRGANSSHCFRAAHPKIPEAHSASGIFPLLLSSSIYPFPVAGIPDSENSPLPGGLPCRKAGIPQSSSG